MIKKAIIIICILLACTIFIATVFLRIQPQLVTGNKLELQQIVITDYGPGESETVRSIITIDDQEKMFDLYESFKRSITKKSYEMETIYSMIAPHYKVVFQYLDSEDEVLVYSREAGRYLGMPDWYAVCKSSRIVKTIESLLTNGNELR